jgi:opacity protein-like surface antigen
MKSIKLAVLTGVFTASASAAMAADLPSRSIFSPEPVMRASRNSTESWYLRGDIGYVAPKRPEADFTAGPVSGSFLRESLSNSATVGVGVGYRFNPNVRVDITADYFNARFRGVAPTPTFATASIEDKGLFQSTTVLVNGYLDFKSIAGFTPYVGAGLGMAHNVFSNYRRTTYDAVAGTETWERPAGGDDNRFAWALMAGVGYRMSSNFTLDLGYRYVSHGDIKTRGYDVGSGADVESIGTHEVRLGVRYGL